MKIRGNTVGTTMPRSDWNQENPNKADYIKNKPVVLDGKSAYDIAVDSGFEGTEAEWLNSLKGEKGDPGEKGEKGDPGEKGEPGEGGVVELVQTVGTSETAVMSQKAVTEELYGLDSVEFIRGSISGSNGSEISSTQRCRSGYLSVCGDEICYLSNTDYDLFGHFYGADNTYLGNTGWKTSFALADYIKANPAISQLRIVVRRKDEATMTVEETVGICWLLYNKFDRTYAKAETVADLGSKDVFALSPFVIYEGGYHSTDGSSVDQEGCSVYRLYLGEGNVDAEGNPVDYTYLYGKTIKIKTYAYGAMAYGFEGEAGTLINPDADIENDPESGVCEFEVTLPEYDADTSNPFFHISFCENAYTGFEIYEKKGTAWEEIKALWMDSYARNDVAQFQELWYEINKLSEIYSTMNGEFIFLTTRVAALEENTPAVYDGSVTVE